MATAAAERRTEERVRAALPVTLGGITGTTRDVSASGLYFEAEASFLPGQRIMLAVEIDTAAGKLSLCCEGNIVRVDKHDGRQGAAVHITKSSLRTGPAPYGSLRRRTGLN